MQHRRHHARPALLPPLRLLVVFILAIGVLLCVSLTTTLHSSPKLRRAEPIRALIRPIVDNSGAPSTESEDIHIVFSLSCDQPHRLLQQTVLQVTATAVGQRGPITQILAGCTPEQRAQVLQEPTFYHDFRRHFAPDFSRHPEPDVDDDYGPYNKPFALRHFLQHAEPAITTKFIALVDGDFAFLHRLQVNTGRRVDTSLLYRGTRDPTSVNDTVRDGLGVAMSWAIYRDHVFIPSQGDLGLVFFDQRDKMLSLCGTNERCGRVDHDDAVEFFGDTASPYILTVNDMRRLIDDYCRFTVLGRQLTNKWVVEMEAYALAAANHGILHTKLLNYAISLPPYRNEDDEYWAFVDVLREDENPCSEALGILTPKPELPPIFFLHYFHSYGYGGYVFNKRDLPRNVTDCESPLLRLPPAALWTGASNRNERRHAWAHCTIVKLLNDALVALKRKSCPDGYNGRR
ncbi:hypothetical protein PINS_up007814 [Pythium insidiosum]|nr:hypothetical protein PINS_up007814 [Pythium insidiosum]